MNFFRKHDHPKPEAARRGAAQGRGEPERLSDNKLMLRRIVDQLARSGPPSTRARG